MAALVRCGRSSGALDGGRIVLFVALVLAASLFEFGGLAMLFPLLTFIEQNGNVDELAKQSKAWATLADVSKTTGIPISYGLLAGGVFTAFVLRQLCSLSAGLVSVHAKETFARHLRSNLFQALIRANAQHLNVTTGKPIAQWFGQICHSAANGISSAAAALTLSSTLLIYLVGTTAFAPLATLAGVTVAASLAFGASKLMARSKLLSRAMTEALEHYASLAAARLRGWRLVKGFATEDQEALKLDEIGKRIGRLNRDHVFQAGLLQIAIGPVALGLLLVGVHFGYYYLDMSIAMIVIFVALMVRLIPIVEQLSRLRHSFTIAEAALERIETLVTEANSARESNTGMMTFAGATNSVSIKDVTFTYPGTLRPAITDCKIELPAGQTIALVGPSGAGKSTLIDLLVRLLMPDSGNITIDGIDLQSYSLSSLRRGIVTAGQSVVFFDDTILANLQYAKPNASKDDLRLALDRGGASDFIKLLPNGMDTVIGEDGLLLSGGQRQRLALARAYLAGAKIIVLDEPTSAMDFEAEKAFREQLAVVAKDPDTTVIIIAHRASTIRDVDQIFVLENGTVTESGSPSELLARNSYYRRMIDADLKIKSPSHDLQPKLAIEEQIQR